MWNRETIVEKIKIAADRFGASNIQQQKQLILGCEKASDGEIFFGLFSFFYDPALQENKIERQELAGHLLWVLSPSCPLKLDGAIYAIPAYWDYSIEQIPWYFCKSYGKSNVVNFLTELIPDVEEGSVIKRSFEILLFWAKSYKEENA